MIKKQGFLRRLFSKFCKENPVRENAHATNRHRGMTTKEHQSEPTTQVENATRVGIKPDGEKSPSDGFPLFEGVNEYETFLVDVPHVGILTTEPDRMVAMTDQTDVILRELREWEKAGKPKK